MAEKVEVNVVPKEGYTQICVWQNCSIEGSSKEDFEKWFLDEVGVRVQFLEEVDTSPDLDSGGHPVPDTGGRTDLFLAMYGEDVGKFAIPRLHIDGGAIKWIEDHYDHMAEAGNFLYPKRFQKYRG